MTEADRARALVDRFWEELLEDEPLLATSVGDERYDDRLPDPGEVGRANRETLHRTALSEASSFDRDVLPEDLRSTLDILEAIATRQLAELAQRTDRLSSVSHLWGPPQLLAEIGTLQRADTPERVDRLVARLSSAPAYYEAIVDIAREGLDSGVVAPRIVVERSIAQVRRLLETPLEDSPALQPVPQDEAEARARVAEVLAGRVHPALASYLEALEAYLPSATETLGLSALPDGDAMYATEILVHTTLPLDPAEVHAEGLDELARIQEERRACAEALGYPSAEAAIAGLDASGANRVASREDLVALAQEQVGRSWDAAPAWFGRLPKDQCEVRAVEPFRERDMPFAFYNPPSQDGSRRGIYYVNAFQLEHKPLHHLASTTYHEANPGHHFQISIEQEMGDRPALRRFGGLLAGNAFAEGWGLYSERLADEMGLFLNEAERLGMLDLQGMRAARLVVDTGIHAFGWDRDRAIGQMQAIGLPRVDAEIEVDRYVTLPGQALCYMVGQREIERLRAEAAAREGIGFSLRAFHDRVLALGSLPLPAFRRELGAA